MPPPDTDVVEPAAEAEAEEAQDPRDEGVSEVIEAEAEAEAADGAAEPGEQEEPVAQADSDDAPESEADRGA